MTTPESGAYSYSPSADGSFLYVWQARDEATHKDRLLQAAAFYTQDLGWPVMPVRGKVSALSGGAAEPQDVAHLVAAGCELPPKRRRKWGATSDVSRASDDIVWNRNVTGLAVLLGREDCGQDVLDLDASDKWREFLAALGWSLERLKAYGTPIVRSGGEGERYHVYFRGDKAHRATSNQFPGLGIDFKGGGRGYVVLPPSIHPETHREYVWEALPGEGLPDDAPEWPEELLLPVTLLDYVWRDEGRQGRPWKADGTLAEFVAAVAAYRAGELRLPEAQDFTESHEKDKRQPVPQRALAAPSPAPFSNEFVWRQRLLAVLARACDDVAGLNDGRRRAILKKAHTLGGYVAGHLLVGNAHAITEDEVAEALVKAAGASGKGTSTPQAREKAARDGFRMGLAKPRTLRERPKTATDGQQRDDDDDDDVVVDEHEARHEDDEGPCEFLTMEQLDALCAASPREWLVPDLLPFGHLVMIPGRAKRAGKSTLAWGLIGAAERGDEFLGHKLPKTKAVILTEEHRDDARAKRLIFRIQESRVVIRQTRNGATLAQATRQALRVGREIGARILLVDTLHAWGGLKGDDMNKAGAADALVPLQEAVTEGWLVLLIHHTVKNTEGRDGGLAASGHNSITGAVESIMEVRATGELDSLGRVLHMESRVVGTKALAVAWDTAPMMRPVLDENGTHLRDEQGQPRYEPPAAPPVLLPKGNPEKAETEQADAYVLAFLHDNPGWHRKDAIVEEAGRLKDAVASAVVRMARKRQVMRDGKGRPGSPYVYAMLGTPRAKAEGEVE